MTLDEEAKVAGSCLYCSGTGISGLSKEQLDLLLETFESNDNPSAEQTSELAQKLKLTTGQVELWFRKGRLDYRKKVEALTRELECLLQGIVTPELQRRIQEYVELGLLQDKLKARDQENEQRTRSSHRSGLSKEQLDLLLEIFKRNPNPSAEQTSELAQKLKLTTGQVQLWFRKERLDLPKKMEALTLEIGCQLQGIVTPKLQRLIEQDQELRLLREENKVLELKLENLIKLRQDKAKVPDQEKEQLTKLIAGRGCSERENMVGAVQLGPPPTAGPYCDTGTPSYRMRKRASENSFAQGKKNIRRE